MPTKSLKSIIAKLLLGVNMGVKGNLYVCIQDIREEWFRAYDSPPKWRKGSVVFFDNETISNMSKLQLDSWEMIEFNQAPISYDRADSVASSGSPL